ncbi:MAG: hypothetical protein WB615_08555 [Candidatus Tumulicola sp.]
MRTIALVPLLLAVVANVSGNAPADRYFGKLGMSALRIRYEILQLRPRYETHKLLPEEAEHLATLDEDAFYAWAASYPHDAWLASTGYMLAQFYEELPGSDARTRAVRALSYVKAHFPKTTYAREATAALHRGVATRPDPAWAIAMRAARATPAPSPPSSTARPSATPSSASATPSPASATPAPAPAAPSPSPKAT